MQVSYTLAEGWAFVGLLFWIGILILIHYFFLETFISGNLRKKNVVIKSILVDNFSKIKGVGNEKIDIFKEFFKNSRTYEVRGQGKKSHYKIKTKKHLTLFYKSYLQNRHRPP